MSDAFRPQKLNDFTGQTHFINQLKLKVEASLKRDDALGHLLFAGPAGLGKTTLAKLLANEMEVHSYITSGPNLNSATELINVLRHIKRRDIVFIDEIHRMRIKVEEFLYPAIEDFELDLKVNSKPVQIPVPKFTLIGATTHVGAISKPLRTRFGQIYRMDYYKVEEMASIIHLYCNNLGFEITDEGAKIMASVSRGTPRVAVKFVSNLNDYITVKKTNTANQEDVEESMRMLGVDEFGLRRIDRKYITVLVEHFNGGPAGLKTLATACDEDDYMIEETLEPYLVRQGYVNKTKKGRKLTDKGIEVYNNIRNFNSQ